MAHYFASTGADDNDLTFADLASLHQFLQHGLHRIRQPVSQPGRDLLPGSRVNSLVPTHIRQHLHIHPT
ncbi:hypothetical protein D3C73_1454460 [compost metagenome]